MSVSSRFHPKTFRPMKLTTISLSVKTDNLAFMSIVYSILNFFTSSTELEKTLMEKERRQNLKIVLAMIASCNEAGILTPKIS